MEGLGLIQRPIIRPRYPHMMAGDERVWTRYLTNPLPGLEGCWYDVHVGEPVKPTGIVDVMDMRISEGLTEKRIDVICKVKGGYWVVEVKPIANMRAVGQALIYARLFAEKFKPSGLVIPMIVCDQADPDIIPYADELGVGIVVNS